MTYEGGVDWEIKDKQVAICFREGWVLVYGVQRKWSTKTCIGLFASVWTVLID